MVVLGTPSDEIHRVSSRSELDVLAAIVETICELLAREEVDRLDGCLFGRGLLRRRDVYKRALIWRACKVAEEGAKVVSACWA